MPRRLNLWPAVGPVLSIALWVSLFLLLKHLGVRG
jgi:hypothetical protein